MRLTSLFPLAILLLLQTFVKAQTNDAFANRITLGGASASAISNTAPATSEPGEPSHAGVTPAKSLWWSWTAPVSGVVNFSTFGSISSPYWSTQALAVYTGGSLTTLSEAGSSNGQSVSYYSPETGRAFNLQVTAGTVYQIALESVTESESGAVMLNINQPPTIVSNATAVGMYGASFSYEVQASSLPSGYSASGLPAGLSINPFSGVISGTPSEMGTFAVPLAATNGGGTGTATLTLTIGNTPPAATAPALLVHAALSGMVGASFSEYLFGTGGSPSYAATGLPPGLSVDVTSGRISGTPTAAGVFPVAVSATNAVGTTGALVTVRIAAGPEVPVFSSAVAASGTVGQSFYYSLTASSSPGSYTATNPPPGLGFDISAKAIKGVPTAVGTYVVPISATNAGGTGTAVLTITVKASAAPAQLQITSAAKLNGVVGTLFSSVLTASGNPTGFSASGLPPGLSLNPQTGYITGTPVAAGTSLVAITATDGSATTGATLTFTMTNVAATTVATTTAYIASSAGASGVVGSAFAYYPYLSSSGGFSSVTYSAAGLPPGLSISPTSGTISGTPTLAGNYAVPLSVTLVSFSGPPVATSAVVTIAVAAFNAAPTLAPVITSSANFSGVTGSAFSQTLAATDQATAFAATGLPPGLSLNAATGAITGTPTAAGAFPMALAATNAVGTGNAAMTITVNDPVGSLPPTPVITSDATKSGTVGSSLTYSLAATNSPTGYTVSDLPPGLVFNSGSASISGTPTTAGVFVVPVVANNAGGTGQAWLTFTISAVRPPVLTGAAAVTAVVGSSFTYYPYASNSPTGYTAGNLPPGLTLNATSGTVTGTPTTAGTYLVPFSATNAGGTGNAVITMIVANPPAPAFSSATAAVRSGTVGVAFSASLSASNSPTGYAASDLPPGLSQSATTGLISGTPTVAGKYSVLLSATNASGTGTATLTFVIAPVTVLAPVISSSAAAGGLVGVAFNYAITANNVPTSYAAAGLPAGLSLNAGTGVISGSPLAGGVSDVAISATNAGGTGSATLRVVIDAAVPLAGPVISSSAGANAALNEVFYFPVTASQVPTGFSATGLPAGLTLNAATGVISGTPTSSGTFTVALTASNALGSGSASLVLRVLTGSGVPRLKSSAGAAGVKNTAFSYTITGTYSPTGFSATGLPPGLVRNASTGAISGTPTASGTYAVSVSAFTSVGTLSGIVTIQVTDVVATVPVITSSAGMNGVVGDSFGYAVAASNSPASFAVTGLPPGLSLNSASGLISGTPTASGTFNVAVSATNAAGTGTATVVVKIAAATTPRFTSSAGAGGLVGAPFTYKLMVAPAPFSSSASSLPGGLSYNSVTSEISGTPTSLGNSVVSLSSSGSTGNASASVRISISAEPVSPPVIASRAAALGYLATDFSYTITASERPTLFAATNLPPGLTLDPATGIIRG